MQKQLSRLPFLAVIIATLTLTLSHVGGANTAPAKPDVKKIFGRIQYVTVFPDYKVEVVSALEDLRVQEVTALANSAGKWQIVTALPDFKIQKSLHSPISRSASSMRCQELREAMIRRGFEVSGSVLRLPSMQSHQRQAKRIREIFKRFFLSECIVSF